MAQPPHRGKDQSRKSWEVWLFLTLLLACTTPPPPPPFDPAADRIRREALQKTLKLKLGDSYSADVPGLSQADRELGKEIFGKSCSNCHGGDARGEGAELSRLSPPFPPDLLDPERASFLSDAAQMEIIRFGSPGTAMPPMSRSLPDPYLLNAYAYIQDLRAQAQQSDAINLRH